MGPTFSVIIPTLNEEKFVGNLLESLVAQTQKDFEVIVVDGKSKDRTVEVVNSFKEKLPSLHLIIHDTPHVSAQRNRGAAKAKGTWLAFIDADTILTPSMFKEVQTFLVSHRVKLLTTWCLSDGSEWWAKAMALLANFAGELSILVHRQLAPGNFAVVSADAFRRVGGYNEDLAWGEDYEFSERLRDYGIKISFLRKRLYKMSFRRMRQDGVVKTLWLYIKSAVLATLTRKTYSSVSGYAQGGARYL